MTNQDHELTNAARCVRRHVRFGWWSLLVFVGIGILLESLLAYKVSWYLGTLGEDYENIRRLMWRLAHAHGTLLSLVHLVFAMTVHLVPGTVDQKGSHFASPCLMGASLLLPGGFFLGGIFTFQEHADPGIGVFLVPVGALLMLVSVLLTAKGLTQATRQATTATSD